jgi:hypothetical protein
MVKDLFDRVKELHPLVEDADTGVKAKFIDMLLADTVGPSEHPFLTKKIGDKYPTKDDMVFRYFRNYFEEREISLIDGVGKRLRFNTIYRSVNKEPLKAVAYGIANSEGIPVELQRQLTGWENLYLLAGIWAEKYTRPERVAENYQHRTMPELVADLIEKGIVHMQGVHESVETVTDGRTEAYKGTARLPAIASIRNQIEKARRRAKTLYDTFVHHLRELVPEAYRWKKRIDEFPLKKDDAKKGYDKVVGRIRKFVDECPFREEFLIRYEAGPGKQYGFLSPLLD